MVWYARVLADGMSILTQTGAIVSVYNAGQAIGGMTTGYLADKISRKYTLFVASFLSTSF
jgi:MFS family permease